MCIVVWRQWWWCGRVVWGGGCCLLFSRELSYPPAIHPPTLRQPPTPTSYTQKGQNLRAAAMLLQGRVLRERRGLLPGPGGRRVRQSAAGGFIKVLLAGSSSLQSFSSKCCRCGAGTALWPVKDTPVDGAQQFYIQQAHLQIELPPSASAYTRADPAGAQCGWPDVCRRAGRHAGASHAADGRWALGLLPPAGCHAGGSGGVGQWGGEWDGRGYGLLLSLLVGGKVAVEGVEAGACACGNSYCPRLRRPALCGDGARACTQAAGLRVGSPAPRPSAPRSSPPHTPRLVSHPCARLHPQHAPRPCTFPALPCCAAPAAPWQRCPRWRSSSPSSRTKS